MPFRNTTLSRESLRVVKMDLPERKIYTVSELTRSIKDRLEEEFPSLWIQGEISNFRPAPSGHYYFTLKDEHSQIRCVMFKTQNRFLKFRPENGLEVIAWGRLSVYGPRGEYQIIFDTMEPRGFGSLMLAFEQLRDKLAAEGLFDDERKKPLPSFPRAVGLVTSRRGAAVRDMIRTARRRSPGTDLLLSSTSVQGDKAPDEIVAALDRICATGDVDVVIIGRGGGSIEDLWAFNDERVVRAVANCPVPIVGAVGHETDFTLTDFAADVRASTPSAAAEIVVPDRRGLSERIRHLTARSRSAVSATLQRCSAAVDEAVKRLYDPRRQILERGQRLDDLTQRLTQAVRRKLAELREDAADRSRRLRPERLRREISTAVEEREVLVTRLVRSIRDLTKEKRTSVESLAARLDGLSPLAVLSRGYSITFRQETDEVVTDAAAIDEGDEVRVRLRRGELDCRVVRSGAPEDD
jgi:exodeoxyribonuclease VII large subunit